ncbi:Sporulation related domain-containing protein [Desulfonatronum thiosulfatophilum]|uniref:Sporulation related domain-containing protein n=2 Tax=Desulfonatronum thiosulfatophilum TaxID=617002 RepID=A0A1G5ZZY9_9BACT|nr:Sporulation related domain-containing protein [Desulfonatronum thiosulfatophilum]
MRNKKAKLPGTTIIRACVVVFGIFLLLMGLRYMMTDMDDLIQNRRTQAEPSLMLRLPVERVFMDTEENAQSSLDSGQEAEGGEDAEDETLSETSSPSEQLPDKALSDEELFKEESPDQEPSDEVISDVQGDASPAEMPHPVPDETVENGGIDAAEHHYFVQVGSYHVRRNAENSASRLKEHSYPAEIRMIVRNGQTWHVVFAHGFAHEREAHEWAAHFREKEQREALVVQLSPSGYRLLRFMGN